MAESDFLSHRAEIKKIYEDTSYFVNAITSDYGFYNQFIQSIADGKSAMSIHRKTVKNRVEGEWISAIETGLAALDQAIRRPSVGIADREEVLPIEFSHNITQKSLQHLAQHTDYISHIEDGVVMPSKILNVFHDETNLTYENKFLNTLIDRLFFFVDRRYSALKGKSAEEENLSMNFESTFRYADTTGTLKLSIEEQTPKGGLMADDTLERVKRIHGVLMQYKGSAFVKSMEGGMIQPPVMRTNAITKNKYLSQCLDLWDYLESYEKVGYEIETEESAENPSEEYLQQLNSLLSLQYMTFLYNVSRDFQIGQEVLETRAAPAPVRPEILRRFETTETTRPDVYETEYRKVYNVYSGGTDRIPPETEMKIRRALDLALKVQGDLDDRASRQGKRNGRRR